MEQKYINDFIKYWLRWYDYIPTDKDIKEEFRHYMFEYENIKVNYKNKVFKDTVNEIGIKLINKLCEKY